MQLEPARSEDFSGAKHAGKTLDSGQPRRQNLPKETEKSESIDSAANRVEKSEDLTN